MNNWNTWSISYEDRSKHDERFLFLKPINGFITGEQARAFFTKSKLSNIVLANIWTLADLNGDGKLDKKEFSIAMFMIKKCLEGNSLPPAIPPTLLQDPQPFIPIASENNLLSNAMTAPKSDSNGTSAMSGNWSIPMTSRPKYRLQFNQNDRGKRGYLTGVEARGIFLKSNLPQATLANIWNLADVDKDGNLTCDEFCIAAFLIDQAVAGLKLPTSLPPTLLPSTHPDHSNTSLGASHSASVTSDIDPNNDRQTFEDKRMQNFLRGQAELDKRKQEMAEQIRQDEENRREKARLEMEKEEKLRQEKEKEHQRQLEIESERQRQLEVQQEARRQQAAMTRLQTLREEQRVRALENERARVEALNKEKACEMAALEKIKAHRAGLLETVGLQSSRMQVLASHCSASQSEVDAHKAAIVEMGAKRDQVERQNSDLNERVEVAKADLHRWQHEHQQLSLQAATGVNRASEQYKTLQNTLKQLNDSKHQLQQQLAELDAGVTQRGQTLASHRHQSEELSKKQTYLATEIRTLRATLLERYKAHREKKLSAVAATSTSVLPAAGTTKPNYDNGVFVSGPTESYIAMYTYKAAQHDELSFAENDRIKIFTNPPVPVCDGWLIGETSDGKRGIAPACYLKKEAMIDPFALMSHSNPFPNTFSSSISNPALSSETLIDSQPLEDVNPKSNVSASDHPILFTGIALYDFEAKLAGDLSLRRDDKVSIISENNGWYDGISMRTQQRGMFPANYVQKLQSDLEPTATNTTSLVADPPTLKVSQSANVEAAPPNPSHSSSPDLKKTQNSIATPVEVLQEEEEDEPVITVSETTELAIATTPFTAQSVEQLSLVPGQYVRIVKRSSKGWWEGEIQQRGQDRQIGWFPADYVRLVNSSTPVSNNNNLNSESVLLASNASAVTAGTTPKNSPSTFKSCFSTTDDLASSSVVQSKFAYKACQADELTFDEGVLITVLAHEEEGWWRGRLQTTGVEGLFPVNYVKSVQDGSVGPSGDPTAALSKPSAVSSSPPPSTMDMLMDALRNIPSIIISLNKQKEEEEEKRRHGLSTLWEQPYNWYVRSGKHSIPVMTDNRNTRRNTILEFIESEFQYCNDLVEVKKNFYDEMKSKNINDKTLTSIFSNWNILCELSQAFSKELQDRKKQLKRGQPEIIADILIRHFPKFISYSEFCAHQNAASINLQQMCEDQRDFAAILQNCERKMKTQAMTLSSYLLKPVQRISKYKQLIEKILKHTDAWNPDHSDLTRALEMASTILRVCNDAIKERENVEQLKWLQERVFFASNTSQIVFLEELPRIGIYRRLLHSGTIFKVKSKKELVAFLFNDMLFLTQPVNSTNKNSQFSLPHQPSPSLKDTFKSYRKPISLLDIRVSDNNSSRHRRRFGWSVASTRASMADLSNVSMISDNVANGGSPQGSLKRRRQNSVSTSMSSLGAGEFSGESNEPYSFIITDDHKSDLRLHVRACSEKDKEKWMLSIRKASLEYQKALAKSIIKMNSSDQHKDNMFDGIMTITIVSASNLQLVGPNTADPPWPFCEVSLCMRSRRTNVILSTRSPKWNSIFKFAVKDVSRDVAVFTIYSKNAHSTEELMGRAEIPVQMIVNNCRQTSETPWLSTFPLITVPDNSEGGSITVSFMFVEQTGGLREEDINDH